jgi:nucleotide-binding universal stress UspA family protein
LKSFAIPVHAAVRSWTKLPGERGERLTYVKHPGARANSLKARVDREQTMYKHILIPTDGSKLAAKGVKTGVRLAKALGAKVTAVFIIPPYMPPMYGEGAMYVPEVSSKRYQELSEKEAKKALAVAEIEAEAAGVPCSTRFVTSYRPWDGILRTARARKCDVVVMASHGRGGLAGWILGSETTKVLAHSKIPVLVTR